MKKEKEREVYLMPILYNIIIKPIAFILSKLFSGLGFFSVSYMIQSWSQWLFHGVKGYIAFALLIIGILLIVKNIKQKPQHHFIINLYLSLLLMTLFLPITFIIVIIMTVILNKVLPEKSTKYHTQPKNNHRSTKSSQSPKNWRAAHWNN